MTVGSREPAAGFAHPLRVAILSFAHPHAYSYARLLRARPDVALVVADPREGTTRDARPRGPELADLLGVTVVPDYANALDGKPDAVIVTAETARHAELVVAAATAGAHVLCEKPLATSMADVLEMRRAVAEAGVSLMTAYPVRFSPAYRSLKARVEAGAVGEVLAVFATNNGKSPVLDTSWFGDPSLAGGGALMDHVVHCADLIDDLLAKRPASVFAATSRMLAPDLDVESAGLVSVVYDDGVIATIDCSWSTPASSPTWGGVTLEVVGTEDTITIRPFAEHVSGFDSRGATWAETGTDLDAAMLDEFLSSVRQHRQPEPDGGAGERTLELVIAAQRSAATGMSISLAPADPPRPLL